MNDDGDLYDFSDILGAAIEASGTGVWDRNVISGEIRYSANWHAILGYDDAPPANRIEESYARVHPDDLPSVMAVMQEHFDGKTSIYEAEHRLRCKDGSYKWVLSRGRVIRRDVAGRAMRMVGTTTDVTATRGLAEQLKILHARACETSEQMVALADALAQRTEELAAAHRLARVGNWRWDLAARWVWFSPEAWWLMGRMPNTEHVSYEQMRAMFHPDDYDRAMEAFYAAVQCKAPVTLEYRMVHADGSVRDVLTHAEPILRTDGEVTHIRGTSQDITPYRRIEAALRESEDHYRHMVDLNPQIPWTAAPDGGILEIGPKWLAMTSMSREETLPFGWIVAVHPEDQAAILAIWRERLATGLPLDFEYRIRLADGGYGWVRARAAARKDQTGRIVRWYGTLEDVTDRHMAEVARRASEALAFRVLEATSDAVVVCDRHGRVTFTNSRAASMLAGGRNLTGQEVGTLFPGAPGRSLQAAVSRAISTGESAQFELYWAPADLWLAANLFVGSGDVSLFLRDVSEQLHAQQKLRYAATHDFMTGAANRASLFAQLSAHLIRQAPGNLVALLCLDLDYFKDVNDAYGHPVGDALLRQMAGRLRSCLRSQDMLSRCGGDEFVIMQVGVKGPRDAVALAEKILEAMQLPFEVEGVLLAGSLSIGIAISTPGLTDGDALYGQADRALYDAKTKTRGQFRLFGPEMQTAFDTVRHLRSDISAGLARGEFSLAFQPIVRLADRRIISVEALLRWRHGERGWIPPSDFIPIAEESGQIAALGAWVLHQACATARDWPEEVTVSVNVSPRQFELSDLRGVVQHALSISGLPASRLKLEMTETILLTHSAANVRTLQELRKLGAALVLDDFGSGYSSLAYLDTFTFDFLKIDKSFISRIRHADDRQPIFEAIVGMAAALGVPVTAEGIETPLQLSYISRLGCEFAQGYLFSPPMEAEALCALLACKRQMA